MEKTFIKKQEISSAGCKLQIAEIVAGAVLAIVGLIVSFAGDVMEFVGYGVGVVGLYFLACGAIAFIPWFLKNKAEPGRYIAFTEDELIVYSPKAENCVSIPMSSIDKVSKDKDDSFSILDRILIGKKGIGDLTVEFSDKKGEVDLLFFGPIDNCADFVSALNSRIKKGK